MADDPKTNPIQLKPEEAVTKVMKVFPDFDPDALAKMFTAFALARPGKNPADLLAAMQRPPRKIDAQTLATAILAVQQKMASNGGALWQKFIQSTWENPGEPPAFNAAAFKDRLDTELDQQQKRKSLALQYLDLLRTQMAKLGITDADLPAKKETTVLPAAPRGPLDRIGALVWKQPVVAPVEKPAKPKGDWLSPEVLGVNDEDAMVFAKDISDATATKAGAEAMSELELLGYTKEVIIGLIARLMDKIQQQIAQSDEIQATVQTDYAEHFEPQISTLIWLGQVSDAVVDFYKLQLDSAPQPAPEPAKTAAPTPTRAKR